MPKKVLRGKEARDALVRGVDFLADSVKVTLGPGGRLVCMSRRSIGQTPQVTKDGVTVANHCDPLDAFEQMGSDLVREAAQKTVEHAGDGTTTSVVLAQAIIHAGLEAMEKGQSPAELEKEIKSSVQAIIAQLEKMALPADGERLAQVATISANGDKEIGRLVHEAIKRVGKDGVMTCEESRSLDTTLDVVDGLQVKQGFRSPHFINDPERLECILENPLILMWEGKVESPKSLVNVVKIAAQLDRPLLTIAGDYDPLALATLAGNNGKNGLRLCAIRADAWGPRRREILQDIAVLTGGVALTEDLGVRLENVKQVSLGSARRVVVNEYRTTIIEGQGDKEKIQVRADEIRKLIQQSDQEDVIGLLRQRLAGLAGGIAVIRVGGATEQEMKEKKDRVEDALYATKAAAEEGIVPGGGMALMDASYKTGNHDGIVSRLCIVPFKQIGLNAGLDIVEILKNNRSDENHGINAATGDWVNLMEAGIIDPVKVVKEALVNAASVACTILKTETLIADIPLEAK